MAILNTVNKFINSKVGLLLLGFSFTTIIGGLFANWVNEKTWERQIAVEQKRQDFEWERSRKFELLKLKLNEGQKSLEEISDIINQSSFDFIKSLKTFFQENSRLQIKTGKNIWKRLNVGTLN